jgi:hypothetical protein
MAGKRRFLPSTKLSTDAAVFFSHRREEISAMMREFGRPNGAPGPYERPLEETPRNIRLEEGPQTEGLRPFRIEEDETSGNTLKIVGGVIVGLLLIGGGFYAYKVSTATTPQQQVALKTPAINHAANDQYPVSAPPPPASAMPAATPAATPPAPPTPVQHPIRAARNEHQNDRLSDGSDNAINAPMTLTPETAPPPQQSSEQSETAMQQPTGTRDVPAGSIAQNDVDAPSVQVPAIQVPMPQQPADPSRAPTEQAQLPPAQAQESAAQ